MLKIIKLVTIINFIATLNTRLAKKFDLNLRTLQLNDH